MIKVSFGRKVSLPGYNNVEVRMEAEADNLSRATDVLNELEGMVGERLNLALEAAGQPAQFGGFTPCKLLVSRELELMDGPLAFIVSTDYEAPKNIGCWYALDHGHRASYLSARHEEKFHIRDLSGYNQITTTQAIFSCLDAMHVLAYAWVGMEVLPVDLHAVPDGARVYLFSNTDAGKEAMREWFDLPFQEA